MKSAGTAVTEKVLMVLNVSQYCCRRRMFEVRCPGRSIRTLVSNGVPPLRRFCVAQALCRVDCPATRCTLRRNTANMTKI